MVPIESCAYKIPSVYAEGAVPHTHTNKSEIIQTFENAGKILIDGEVYKMIKTGLYFINGRTPHFVMPDDITRYSHSIIIFPTSEVERICRNLNIYDQYYDLFIKDGGTFCNLSEQTVIDVDKIFLNIKTAFYSDNPMKYAVIAAELIHLMDIGLKNRTEAHAADSKLSEILSYINDNIENKFSMDDLSKAVNVSKYHMCRMFKDSMGITIGALILSKRLSIAKSLLLETNDTITQIAEKTSFSSSSTFTKVFVKEIGCTPTAFRAKYR